MYLKFRTIWGMWQNKATLGEGECYKNVLLALYSIVHIYYIIAYVGRIGRNVKVGGK